MLLTALHVFYLQFGGFETITNALCDKYPDKLYKRRTLLACGVAIALMLVGIPLTMSVSYGSFLASQFSLSVRDTTKSSCLPIYCAV